MTTPHGVFDTPCFMTVGTQAAVKGLTCDQLTRTGAQILLANTYHLMLRPGADLVQQMGGLQHWTGWHRPMLTDSGGYQVFSLAEINKISDEGVRFRSHIDGRYVDLTPEVSIAVQNQLGADIIMAFDDCPPGDAGAHRRRVELANERTTRWLDRCIAAHARPGEQALFGIVQGGTDLSLREQSLAAVTARDLPGYAIGGVAVGEGPAAMQRVVEHLGPRLPADRPRYLMGVGYERDIVMAVRAGVDMFDCVLPTRNGRNAVAFTREGPIRLKNARFRDDPSPIDPDCDCPACGPGRNPGTQGPRDRGRIRSHLVPGSPGPSVPSASRSYLRHLFQADEMLGPILTSAHNLRHFQRLMLDIRTAMTHNDWSSLFRAWPILGGGR